MTNKIDEIKCYICENVYNSNLQLTMHVNTSKTCKLIQKEKEKLQNNINEMNELKQNYINEMNELKQNYINEINELKQNHINEINELKINHKDEIKHLEQQISNLETANEIYKKISDKPTVNNTNSNNKYLSITNNFTLIDDIDKIKDIIDTKLTDIHVIDGQKGIAKFALESIISDEDGYLNYICSDSSRNIFKYKNGEGIIQKDAKAIRLTNALVKAGIKSKSVNIAEDLWTKEDGKRNDMKYEMCNPGLQEIIKMKSDNTVFRNKLSDSTS
jgi:hypothetical protein